MNLCPEAKQFIQDWLDGKPLDSNIFRCSDEDVITKVVIDESSESMAVIRITLREKDGNTN